MPQADFCSFVKLLIGHQSVSGSLCSCIVGYPAKGGNKEKYNCLGQIQLIIVCFGDLLRRSQRFWLLDLYVGVQQGGMLNRSMTTKITVFSSTLVNLSMKSILIFSPITYKQGLKPTRQFHGFVVDSLTCYS